MRKYSNAFYTVVLAVFPAFFGGSHGFDASDGVAQVHGFSEIYISPEATIVRRINKAKATQASHADQRSHAQVNRSHKILRRRGVVRRNMKNRRAEVAMTPVFMQGPWQSQMNQMAMQRNIVEQTEHRLEQETVDNEQSNDFPKILAMLHKTMAGSTGSQAPTTKVASVAIPAAIAAVAVGAYAVATGRTSRPGANTEEGANKAAKTDVKLGQKETPKSLDELKEILKSDSHVKLDRWGKSGANDISQLFKELAEGDVELKWQKADEGLRLQRRIKSMTVQLCANTTQGERALCCGDSEVTIPSTNLGKKETLEDKKNIMLAKELDLDVSWIRKHTAPESQQSRVSSNTGSDSKEEYPGLCSKRQDVAMTVRVKNPQASTIKGRLGLPAGDDFLVKGQTWRWVVPSKTEAESSRGQAESSTSSGHDTD
jgi:hypothetical protein